jgi:hypothetical protein
MVWNESGREIREEASMEENRPRRIKEISVTEEKFGSMATVMKLWMDSAGVEKTRALKCSSKLGS